MKLIVGLGNPGRTYKYSRHNIGFLVIERLAENLNIKMKLCAAMKIYLGRGRARGEEVILVKPLTFMNLSGQSVNLLFKKYDFGLEDVLVVFDDVDLGWGKIRIRPKGSAGGHKGVKSIIDTLGSSNFARLRFGIGRPEFKAEVSDYVLSRWSKEEKKELAGCLNRAADCCENWVISGIDKSMDKFN
ncbi:MAG: aminoacyl-tRNA hydrolase [Candidatus Omnitrophota bacterium]